jgi:GNAT superfamily N-acetyltransferase
MSIELSLLDPGVEYPGRKQFDCGHAVTNKFVRDSLLAQVKKKLGVAYVLTDSSGKGRLLGFFTIANHAIDASSLSSLQLGSLPKKIPCVSLGMLGIDKHDKKQKWGSLLMKQALLITKVSSMQIGCFGLYLDADSGAVGFYQKLGFALLEGDKSPESSPMFIAVRSIA